MADRTLVLHGGFAKTGTSALQVGFARNRDWLLEQGIDYLQAGHFEVGLRGAVSSGNAVQLATHLCGLEDHPQALAEPPGQLAASGAPHMLLSSEFFQSVGQPQLQALVDAARGAGRDVQAVFLVRPYYDWLWSAYVQNVKNHAVTATFADWAMASGLAHMFAGTIERYDAVLGPDNVRIVNYDGIRANLLPEFLRVVFGVEASEGGLLLPSEINRSLTTAELRLLRRFNALRGSEADGTTLSNLLITASPQERAARETDRKVLRWLEKEVGADIARFDDRIIGGALRVAGEAVDDADAGAAAPNASRPMVSLLLQTFAVLMDTRRELEQVRVWHAAQAERLEQLAGELAGMRDAPSSDPADPAEPAEPSASTAEAP